MSEWISVDDRMPDPHKRVQALTVWGTCPRLRWIPERKEWLHKSTNIAYCNSYSVKAWRPIPTKEQL